MPVPQQQDSQAVIEVTAKLALKYPIPEFEGEHRWPATGWMVVDLIAFPPSSLDPPIIRTFQARELINDDVSVALPGLRTQSFFAEVRKLLVYSGIMSTCKFAWNDKVLNERELEVQNAKVVGLLHDDSLLDGTHILEDRLVVEIFEKATDKGLEELAFYVEWYDPTLSQGLSVVTQQDQQQACQRLRSILSRKRLRKTMTIH